MEENEEDMLGKLLQTVKPDVPGPDFTGSVMKMIELNVKQDHVKETALKELLQNRILIERPSKAFSRNIMRQIAPVQIKAEPIISLKTWYMIAASVAITIMLCFFIKEPQAAQHTSSLTDQALNKFSAKLESLPVIYPATIFGVACLMMLDYILREVSEKRMMGV